MNISDLVALAKAGYSPKQVKELLEMVETSPAVKETPVEVAIDKQETPKTETVEKVSTQDSEDDPIQTLVNILKGEK